MQNYSTQLSYQLPSTRTMLFTPLLRLQDFIFFLLPITTQYSNNNKSIFQNPIVNICYWQSLFNQLLITSAMSLFVTNSFQDFVVCLNSHNLPPGRVLSFVGINFWVFSEGKEEEINTLCCALRDESTNVS